MNSFKSGSGNLDFGEDESDEEETSTETTDPEESSHPPSEHSTSKPKPAQTSPPHSEQSSDQSETTAKYPYFVRRNNVGDERDNRLEIHVRDKVTEREAAFRNELAELLGVDEIMKTDAREFALLAAYQNPDHIAEYMREEGFGELD